MKERNTSSNLKEIREELERRLFVMRYSKVSTYKYMSIFTWVEKYLSGYGEKNYTKELGERFLVEYSLQPNHTPNQFKASKKLVRRIDDIIENKQFTLHFKRKEIECPPRFAELLENYNEYLIEECGFSKSTYTTRRRYTIQLLERLPEAIVSLEELTAVILYDVFTKHEWIQASLATAKSFLSFLYERKITKTNLTICVPKPTRPRPLPSIYSGDEVSKLLLAVDRSFSIGMRDYAILMIAAHLGLRSCDIAELTFKSINQEAKTIEIIQQKTGNPLTLIMNNEVEEAISEYIQKGRPDSSSERIFLGSRAPFLPLTAAACFEIARKYFNYAGIPAQGRRRGTHALRASFATALIGKGVPYTVVKKALGHENPDSAKYYVRVDVKRLRMCALEVPKPIGAFAVLLGDLEGVL